MKNCVTEVKKQASLKAMDCSADQLKKPKQNKTKNMTIGTHVLFSMYMYVPLLKIFYCEMNSWRHSRQGNKYYKLRIIRIIIHLISFRVRNKVL